VQPFFYINTLSFVSLYQQALRAKGILVRPKKDAEGTCGLRVSLGTFAQTERLIATLEEVLGNSNKRPRV